MSSAQQTFGFFHREKILSASEMRQLPGTLRFLAASESGESQTSGLTPTARLGCGRSLRQNNCPVTASRTSLA